MKKKPPESRVDWNLWTWLEFVSDISSTNKEIEGLMETLPSFSDIIRTFLKRPDTREVLTPVLKQGANYFRDIIKAHEKGKKIAFINFNFPPSIFYAMDIVPLVPEIVTGFTKILDPRGVERFIDFSVDEGVPETMCNAQKGAVGALLTGYLEEPDMVVNATSGACDANSGIFNFVSEYLDLPFCNVDSPPHRDEGGRKYYQQEFRKLVSFLEEQTGKKLKESKLRKVTEEVEKEIEYIQEIYDLRKATPNPVPSELTAAQFVTLFMGSGTPETTNVMKKIYEVSKRRYKQGKGVKPREKARILCTYLTHWAPGGNLWPWLDHNGITVLNEVISVYGFELDPQYMGNIDTSTRESCLDSLAEQAVQWPMTRNMSGPYDFPEQWGSDMVSVADELDADAAVYMTTEGCKNSWGVVKVLAKKMKEELGIPTLITNQDVVDERVQSWSSIADDIEEFVETTVMPRKRRG